MWRSQLVLLLFAAAAAAAPSRAAAGQDGAAGGLRGTVRVERLVVEEEDGGRRAREFTFGLFEVDANRTAAEAAAGAGAGQGSARLWCPPHTLIESRPTGTHRGRPGALPVYLLPLDAPDPDHAFDLWPHRLLAATHGRPGGASLTYALLLGERGTAGPAAGAGLRPADLGRCELAFLTRPARLAGRRATFSALQSPPAGPSPREAGRAAVRAAARLAARELAGPPQGDVDAWEGGGHGGAGAREACRFEPEGDIFLSADAAATVGNFIGVVKSGFGPALDTLTEAQGSGFAGVVSAEAGNVGAPGLVDDLTLQITRSLTPQVTQLVVPSLAETLPASLTPSVSMALADYLEKSVTKEVTRSATEQLTTELGRLLPEKIDIEAPRETAKKVGADLGHLLTKSISHSVVPALLHTLTHSPLQDYYCYYCFHHQTYCKFCQYAPSQLYYGNYYVGYFSSFYADYYSKFYAAHTKMMMEDEVRREKQLVNDRERWETVEEA